MQRGRQVAGPVHGGGRSRSLAHAGRSAMKGAHSQPPQSHRYTDDEDSAPNMATTYRKMAIVLGKRGWPSAVSELKKRAEREVQRNTAMGTSANGASLWAGNGGNGKANEVIVSIKRNPPKIYIHICFIVHCLNARCATKIQTELNNGRFFKYKVG